MIRKRPRARVWCGWLTDAELQAFDAWLYDHSSLDLPHLSLFSQGTASLSGEDISALRIWDEAVFARLAATW